jgi:O-antigen/teichoic acid export membrane protein
MSSIRVGYSGLISLITGLLSSFTGIFYLVMITRSLSTLDYGTWGLISGLVFYPLVLERIISYWSTREISREETSGKTSIIFSSILSTAGFGLYLLIIILISPSIDAEFSILLLAASLIPLMFVQGTLFGINYGSKPHAIGYGKLSFSITNVPMVFLFVYFLDYGITGVIFSNIIAYFISNLVLFYSARKILSNPFKLKFIKKWIKLSWIPLYPALTARLFQSDVIIFSLVTGSVIGLAFWSAASSVQMFLNQSTQITQAVYPKSLQGGQTDWMKENLTLLIFVMIPFLSVTIIFSKPMLFILNPDYVTASIVVIFLAFQILVKTIGGSFHLYLLGKDEVDLESNSIKNYAKSKLVFLPTIRLVRHSIFIGLLIVGLYLLVIAKTDLISLLIFWSFLGLITEIPLTLFLYRLTVKTTKSLFDKNILKFILIAICIFIPTYLISNEFLAYDLDLFSFLFDFIPYVLLSICSYFLVSILIDKKIKNLTYSIIKEIKSLK